MDFTAQLGATRSSHNWKDMPGNWDRLNTRALFDTDNQWGIPLLPPVDIVPDRLIAYNDRYACDNAKPGDATHFFLDDYRFETLWSKPERPVSRLKRVGISLTPDFSLWREMPLAMQLWQVYRSRWCGCWMQFHGVPAVPTVSWSTKESYEFCFAGIPRGSTVAISTVGVRDDSAKWNFAHGVEAMLYALNPAAVLCYGRLDEQQQSLFEFFPVKTYPTRWES